MPSDAKALEPGPQRLAGRLASQDPDALRELYDQTSRLVFGLILRIVGDRAAAEEIALDVYLQVWRRAGSYDPERASFLSWLTLLARSRALDYLRSKQGRARAKEQELDPLAHASGGSPEPDAAAWAADRRKAVLCALSTLDQPRRAAIEMAFFEGYSHSEIAERLDAPLGTVKTRIRTGMRQLREQLAAYKGAN
jgi:RNA polymerase sigma-70 factor (ECF subfamily)